MYMKEIKKKLRKKKLSVFQNLCNQCNKKNRKIMSSMKNTSSYNRLMKH